MRTPNDHYDELRADIDTMPVIDTHEHVRGREKTSDILQFLGVRHFMVAGPHYVGHDYVSAIGEDALVPAMDPDRPLEERWPAFERAYRASRFTGYGRALRYGLERVFGSAEVTLDNVRKWQEQIPDYSDPEAFEALIAEARVLARISDNYPPVREVVAGTYQALPGQYLAIHTPQFHQLKTWRQIENIASAAGTRVTSLGEYEEVCRSIFQKWRAAGAVCFKDQSAYERSLAYGLPTRAEAEQIFNHMLANPRESVAWGEHGHALSDYLIHSFMRMARDLDLPVQIHTGHMAGYRNDVTKANASHLRLLLETHKDVSFDLFHANWPYSGDLLFLGKNYPNVSINFCWAHQVDPIYSARMMVQSVATVPYTKIHGIGSDVDGYQPHNIWSHVKLGKDVIATALAELIGMDYIDYDDALEIAEAWLSKNAIRFFRLPID